jgi:BirA family biotin operon repressor/biotin-[acetyl-CoA-carboxylase] ligase
MEQAIRSLLPRDFPWEIRYIESIGSTNTALRDAPHGTVLIAGSQTAGRGRMGRSFHSPKDKGLYLSVLLRPQCKATELMHLTCAAAVAAAEAMPVDCGIKWTNDLVIGKKKLGGILTELSLNPDGTVKWAIIGIGINRAHSLEDFPRELQNMATSLALETPQVPTAPELAAGVIVSLKAMYDTLLTGKEAMLKRYKSRCVTLGQEISLVRGDDIRYGKALDVDEEGALVVSFRDGHPEAVTSGEVSIRGMYGYV